MSDNDNRYLHLIRQNPLPAGTHTIGYCRDSTPRWSTIVLVERLRRQVAVQVGNLEFDTTLSWFGDDV